MLAVIRDISERKQVEDIRRRAYEELEQLVAERTAGLQSDLAATLEQLRAAGTQAEVEKLAAKLGARPKHGRIE